MDITEEIYKTIDVIVQRYVDGQKTSPQYSGVVTDSNNGKYTVLVNGSKYLVKDGVGINPKPNTTVWIMVPNNDWNQAYICAGKNNKPEAPVSTVLDVWENGTSVVGSDMIARINCATTAQVQQVQNNLEESVLELQENFQAGVDAVYDAVEAKGTTPASHSLSDVVTAIGDIQTGGNYMTKEIREDGIYYASDDDVDAYDVVVVSKDVGQPHTVVFYDADGSTIIKTQANVPYHGYASCTLLDGTTLNGQYFKGWNPLPTNIVRDTFCYPIYGDYIITPGEIEDDWETICALNGAGYPLGSYKALVVNVPARPASGSEYCWNTTNDGKQYTVGAPSHSAINVAMQMVKVAEGEDGTTSTWLSTKVIPLHPTWAGGEFGNFGAQNGAYLAGGVHAEGSGINYTEVQADWGTSMYREYLNSFFIQNIPEVLGETIKQVNKQYASYARCPVHTKNVGSGSGDVKVYKTSLDKIWIPSVKELHSYMASKNGWSNYSSTEEPSGIDYTSVYMPTYPTCHLTRTLHIAYNAINCLTANASAADWVGIATTGCPGAPIGFCL